MRIMISGSHGLVGAALIKQLERQGDEVTRLERRFNDQLDFSGVDAVIHLAGESIASGRWNTAKKNRIEESRVKGTNQLTELIATSENKPGVLFQHRRSVITAIAAMNFFRKIVHQEVVSWPKSVNNGKMLHSRQKKQGVRTVTLRTGIVLDKKGGALNKMLHPFRMGGGGILGNGKQYMSWISLDDMVSAIQFIVNEECLKGAVNLTARMRLQIVISQQYSGPF